MKFLSFSALFLLLLVMTLPVQAHRLNLSVWSAGESIYGKTGYGRENMAKDAHVAVYHAESKELLLETTSDAQGLFQFVAPQGQHDLLIVVDAGQGHRAELLLEAEDYTTNAVFFDLPQVESLATQLDMQQLRQILAEEIRRELAPVKQSLASLQAGEPNFRDILGGLGWIFGLAGLAAWLQSRKKAQ